MAKSELSVLLSAKDNLSPTLKNVQKSLSDMGEKTSKLDDIQKSFNKINTSSAPLSKKVRDIRKQMEQLAVSNQYSTAEGQKMWKQMSEAAKKYDETLKKIQSDTRSVGDSAKGGFDMKNLASGMADKVGLGGVSSQIGGALANPYVLAGAAIAGAGKALYDYNVELDRSLQKTAQFTGLSGDALMNLRNGIKSVADTFGKDFDTVLAAVDGLMNQFHIDGEEALKIIKDGFVAGADDSGRMLDLIKQYSGAFNDVGISASEMVAIIGNTRSGIFSEEGMALIAKGGARIREFSSTLKSSLEAVGINADDMYNKLQSGEITTIQALQSISSHLKGLNPQSQEVGEIMKQVFSKQGASAGYELITALADVNSNLEEVKKQTGEWGEAMEQLQQADRELENALATLFGVSEGGFSNMSTKLKAEVYGGVAKVINGFIDWYNKSLVVRAEIQNIAVTFKNAWEVIKAILKIFMTSLKSLGELIEGILTLDWDKVKSSWKNGMSSILKTVADGFENISNNVANGINETLHGEIKKIEVPVETKYTEGKQPTSITPKKKNNTSSNQTDESGSTKGKKKEEIVDENSLKYAENKVSELTAQLARLDIGSAEFEQTKKLLDEWTKIKDERAKAAKIGSSDISTLQQLKNELAETLKLQENAKTDEELETLKEKAKRLKKEIENEEIRVGIKPYIDPNSKKGVDSEISAIKEELNNIDITLNPEKYEELIRRLKEAQKKSDELAEKLSGKSVPSVKGVDNTNFEKGSVEDKRQSLSNANQKAEQVRSDYKLGLINADEAKQQLESIQRELQAAFPELNIDLHFNQDGTITTFTEDIEKAKEKLDAITGTIGSVGSAFSSVGSAIGGTSGEIMNFAGQSIQAIGQIIPQIVALIGAKQAEATASGTASAAALPFPANIAAIASIVATIASVFASLPQFAEGGIVGGTSYSGDKIIARLNSGEAVLTKKGVDNLNRNLNNNFPDNNSSGMGGRVEFVIDGRNLKGVLKNVNNKIALQS